MEAEGDIELTCATTCHNAKGGSSEVVIIAVEDTHFVTREWVYIAIMRGQELVLFVGADKIARSVRTTPYGRLDFVAATPSCQFLSTCC